MKTEFPKFKRCCLCIPLRRGLLAWGYTKMVLMILTFFVLLFLMEDLGVITWISIACTIVDTVFNLVLVIGAHKKHIRTLFVYYYYGLVSICVMTILSLITIIYSIYTAIDCFSCIWSLLLIVLFGGAIAMQVLELLLEVYLVMLVRSEILKLKDQRVFHFVNANKDIVAQEASEADTQIQIKYDRLPNDI